MTADRIELETKVTMLERTVDALSGELHQHAKTIEALQQQVRQLGERLRARSEPDVEPHDSPPPHYHGE